MLRFVLSSIVVLLCGPRVLAVLQPNEPPRADRIEVRAPNAAGETEIVGGSGAVAGGAAVHCMTIDTGHYVSVRASADGSFRCTVFAPAGASVWIKTHPSGFMQEPPLQPGTLAALAATIVRVADSPTAENAIRFAGAGLTYVGQKTPLPAFTFRGEVPKLAYAAGDSLVARGTLEIDSPAVERSGAITMEAVLLLERLTGPDGAPTLAQSTFASAFMTPTGLPIEHRRRLQARPAVSIRKSLTKNGTRAQADIELALPLDAARLAGYYRPYIGFSFEGLVEEDPPARAIVFDPKGIDRAQRRPSNQRSVPATVYAPIIRIGDPLPPRMVWTLLTDHRYEGTYGTRAIEDRMLFDVSGRIATQSPLFVVPRVDPSTGAPIRYRIEPHAPAISVGDRADIPNAPLVPFRFPSGSLRVRIDAPGGARREIGPAPFTQSRSINPVSPGGFDFDSGGGHLTDPYQLTTMNPAFEVTFDRDGLHVIRMEGEIEDLWGNRWSASGTYEVYVARPLVLDTAVLPGTPFEVGDRFSPAMTIIPPVPAEVDVRVQLLGERSVLGRANAHGYFGGESIDLGSAGEYRVDIVARYVDADGSLWMGSRSWGSIVAPRNSPIVGHGRRGIDGLPDGLPWFRRSDTGLGTGSSHIHVPFHNGDILWAQKSDAAIPIVTFHDPGNRVAPLLKSRGYPSPPNRYENGDGPLFISTPDGGDVHLDPSRADVWAYAYRSVQRPLVRVREYIGEDDVAGGYWRFGELYGGQSGAGLSGDLPNDVKWQFGGIVIRGSAIAEPLYAAYASFFVLVPDDDPLGGSRVFPPFQGNGGGASGGPLFRLKGQDIDIFFHPTGVRPGSILRRGETAVFTGYAAPTLPAKIEIAITSPSGVQRTISGTADLAGYFHDPGFVVEEPGVWRARVRVFFDGRTSAGPVAPPYPTGDVLGSREGEFHFYVADYSALPLDVAPMPRIVQPSEGPIAFTIIPPAELSDVELAYTTTMPGFILEEGTTTATIYRYDAPRLALDFPNLDLRDGDGRTGSDVITISLMLSGTDARGMRRHFPRQIVINGEELHMPEPVTAKKRRAARVR